MSSEESVACALRFASLAHALAEAIEHPSAVDSVRIFFGALRDAERDQRSRAELAAILRMSAEAIYARGGSADDLLAWVHHYRWDGSTFTTRGKPR